MMAATSCLLLVFLLQGRDVLRLGGECPPDTSRMQELAWINFQHAAPVPTSVWYDACMSRHAITLMVINPYSGA